MTTTRTTSAIKAEIAELQARLQFFTHPPVAQITADLNRAVVKATIDPALRGEVKHFSDMLEQAQQVIQQHEAEQNSLAQLKEQLAVAESNERLALVEQNNRQLAAAVAEYEHAARTCCRAYDRLLAQQASNYRLPGSKVDIPPGPDFPSMTPQGWQGRTAEHIRDHSLAWLNKEKPQRSKEAA